MSTQMEKVVIVTNDKASLKPLLESAIENEKKAIKSGLERTRAKLAEFEKSHGMVSSEFERRLNAREIQESFEFTDWRMEIGMLALLEKKYAALQEARIVN